MTVKEQIETHLASLPEPKQGELRTLHQLALNVSPGCREWFHDGRDDEGKIVSNPTIGYGAYTIHYANGQQKEMFRIGLSANSTGISVYIMGLSDKSALPRLVGSRIGKAKVTGYLIRFRSLKDIDLPVLEEAMHYGFASGD